VTDESQSRPETPDDYEMQPVPIRVDLQWTGTLLRTSDGFVIGEVGNPMCACCGKKVPSDELIYRVGRGAYAFLCQECAQGDDWKQLRLPTGRYGDSEQSCLMDDREDE
jgi:hypothetical protein